MTDTDTWKAGMLSHFVDIIEGFVVIVYFFFNSRNEIFYILISFKEIYVPIHPIHPIHPMHSIHPSNPVLHAMIFDESWKTLAQHSSVLDRKIR